MEQLDWTYITALISVAFGWFLNELGQWFRTRKEDRKIKKQVLFYLLETHFTFNKLDTSEITNLLSRKVSERIPKTEQTDEVEQFINQLYAGIIGSLLEDNVAESIEEIEGHYTNSVSELSKLDPITAYRLNGKNKIFQVFDLLQGYYDEVKETFPNIPGLSEQIELTVETVKPEIIKDAISDLEEEIKDISLSINIWTWIRAKKTVNNIKRKIRKDDEKKIDELINKLIPK